MYIKKSIAIFLALLLTAIMLTACGAKPAEPAAQMVNPVSEVTADEMAQKTGVKLSALPGAENVRFTVINTQPAIAQVLFDLGGTEFVYRAAAAKMDATELSGVYFGSCTEAPARVAFADGKLLTEGKTVVVFWEDASAGISYTLSCADCDDPAALKGLAGIAFTADMVSTTCIAGTYKDDNYDNVILTANDDGSFTAVVGIYRLTTFEGTGVLESGNVSLVLTGPGEGTVYASFSGEDDGTCTLTITDSAWGLLDTGTVFAGFVKDSVG